MHGPEKLNIILALTLEIILIIVLVKYNLFYLI